jgi:diguanylate cyclase (GGDEF)-like protein/PAS domain S-box-containing protein
MKSGKLHVPGGSAEEVSALIEALHQAEKRLHDLTSGEVDTVTSRDGRTIMLRHAQDQLRRNDAARQEAILNALPAHIALLDSQGVIISVNEAWQQFSLANAILGPGYGIGVNYLGVCDSAHGDDPSWANQAAKGIRSVLDGKEKNYSLEYPCHSPTEQRWFLMTVTPMTEDPLHGVVVMHLNITERKQAEEEIEYKNTMLQTEQEISPDAILVVDENGKIVSCNQRFIELWRLSPQLVSAGVDAPVLRSVAEQVEDADAFLARVHDLYEHRDKKSHEEMRLKDGRVVDRYSASIQGADGRYYGRVWYFRDITERKTAESRVVYLNRVHAVLSGINALIVRVHDRDELFRVACRVAVDAGGFRMAMIGIVDRGAMKIVPVASAGKDEALLDAIKSLLSSGKLASNTMVARAIRKKKSIVSNDSQSDPQVLLGTKYAEAGVRSMIILPLIVSDEAIGALALYASERNFFHDDELKLLTELAGDIAFAIDHLDKQARLDYLAYYDVLTGLANRTLFQERLEQSVIHAREQVHKLALVLLDIERFKAINDTLGRAAGDILLKDLATRLSTYAVDASRVGRIDADHFAIMVSELQTEEELARLIEQKVGEIFGSPFRIGDSDLRASARFGIAMFPTDGANADILFRNAEVALKKAKAGGERYLFYNQKMNARVAENLTLENQLRQALEQDEFVLYYQPKMNLVSGKLTNAEALIRWNDPRTGLVSPDRFIPILEETGLIYEVGRWALHQAIEDYQRWRNTGLATVRIAVNVSPLQLRNRGFIAEIEQTIGIDAQAAAGLELEITESLIMEDIMHSISSLQAIRAMGITIAIDDFGTGFSSLSYLSKLPVDTLKIDRSFVNDMTAGPEGLALVSTIINLAHSLRLNVVAEGVETEEQSRLLRLLDCDEMQGYLFSKPVPCDIFEARFLAPPALGGLA